MGLLDILNGMQNGPRGPSEPSAPGESGGGMSPMTMAILALLAYKAVKHFGGSQPGAAPAGQAPSTPTPLPGTTTASTGGLGDVLGGGLGGLMKGRSAALLAGCWRAGRRQRSQRRAERPSETISGSGPHRNRELVGRHRAQQANFPGDLASALGADQINTLTSQTGLSRDELLSGLAKQLPDIINQLTPDGRLPTEREASRWI
jgi:uncharacterized protein YidB (DUF937 family)